MRNKLVTAVAAVFFASIGAAHAAMVEVTCPSAESINVRLNNPDIRLSGETRPNVPNFFEPRDPQSTILSAQRFIRVIISHAENSPAFMRCIYSRSDRNLSEHYIAVESAGVNCWPTNKSDDAYRVYGNGRQLSCSSSPSECTAMCERLLVMKKAPGK